MLSSPDSKELEGVIIALDIGNSRIGVAAAHSIAKLPKPHSIIDRTVSDETAVLNIQKLVKDLDAVLIVAGLPMGLSGQHTNQTNSVKEFVNLLTKALDLPIVYVDESYSSVQADELLSGKATKDHPAHNDAMAACVILDRYFKEGSYA